MIFNSMRTHRSLLPSILAWGKFYVSTHFVCRMNQSQQCLVCVSHQVFNLTALLHQSHFQRGRGVATVTFVIDGRISCFTTADKSRRLRSTLWAMLLSIGFATVTHPAFTWGEECRTAGGDSSHCMRLQPQRTPLKLNVLVTYLGNWLMIQCSLLWVVFAR